MKRREGRRRRRRSKLEKEEKKQKEGKDYNKEGKVRRKTKKKFRIKTLSSSRGMIYIPIKTLSSSRGMTYIPNVPFCRTTAFHVNIYSWKYIKDYLFMILNLLKLNNVI